MITQDWNHSKISLWSLHDLQVQREGSGNLCPQWPTSLPTSRGINIKGHPATAQPWGRHWEGPQSFLPEVEAGGTCTWTLTSISARPWVLHAHPSSAQAGTQRSQHQRNKIPFPFSHCTSGRNQHCQGELSYKPGETKRKLNKERICPWEKETLVYCRSFWIIFSSTLFFLAFPSLGQVCLGIQTDEVAAGDDGRMWEGVEDA